MSDIIIFSKVQSRQRVADVKASVALARELDQMVNSQGVTEDSERMLFNHRVTKNLCEHVVQLMRMPWMRCLRSAPHGDYQVQQFGEEG